MVPQSLFSRRHLLGLLTALTVLSLARVGLKLARPAFEVPEPLRSILRLLGPCRRSAEVIGQKYLAQIPEENDRQILLGHLHGEVPICELEKSDAAGWCSKIKSQISNDFSAGRTVLLDGWVISQTEARFCAYCSLIA